MARVVAASVVVLALGVAQPDLVVPRVAVERHGDAVRVTAVVANRGSVAARRTVVTYQVGGTRLGRRVIASLAPRSSVRVSATLALPPTLAAGSYRVRVCADGVRRIREVREQNNCRVAARALVLGDRRAPTFAGLEKAFTCIPGPAGGGLRSSRFNLEWRPAVDETTPASRLVYDVYQATSPGGEDFAKPTYTSEPGATSFTTPELPDDGAYYFVVRARDEAGNRDANRVERQGMNLCV